MFRDAIQGRILGALLLMLAPGWAAGQQGAPGTAAQGERQDVWALEILPLAQRFERATDVTLVLTVRNVGAEPRSISLPHRPEAAWPQWLGVSRDGLALESAEDSDFASEPAKLAPGEQLSVLVGLEKFLSPAAFAAAGAGAYTVRWEGGTIGLAASASASFSVTGLPLAAPRPGSLESFLTPARADESLVERVRAAWSRLATRPSDARLLPFVAALPAGAIEPYALFELLEATRDLGVQRELVRQLGRIGRDALAADRLIEYLKVHRDPSLASLGSAALESLR